MKLIVIATVLVCLLLTAQAQSDPNAAPDAKRIAAVKDVSVHELDNALPDIGFEKWLQKESGPDAQYHWEVNDCGEQSGTPGDNTPVPPCVEVDSTLKDGRLIIFLGDDGPPKSKAPDWRIFFVDLTTAHEKINLRRLSDLPAALIRTHRLGDNPETAK